MFAGVQGSTRYFSRQELKSSEVPEGFFWKIQLCIDWHISQLPLDRFWSNFDVEISTLNLLTDGEIPIFLSCFRKKWQPCKDDYSTSIFTTTHKFGWKLKNSIKNEFPNRFFWFLLKSTRERVLYDTVWVATLMHFFPVMITKSHGVQDWANQCFRDFCRKNQSINQSINQLDDKKRT